MRETLLRFTVEGGTTKNLRTGASIHFGARFGRNLRTARRGVAVGPSGMTCEHLRPLLASPTTLHWFFRLGEHLVTARVPNLVIEAVRMGRMTALRKPVGGIRGIVVGDVIRRLVARTVAQQVATNVEQATAPFQYAHSTRAGFECESHVVQALCEANPNTTIVSVDGVSAYDTISREAMIQGLLDMEGGESALPFVRQFYGRVSSICGRTTMASRTPSCRARVGSRVAHSCPCYTVWGSTVFWRPSTAVLVRQRLSWPSWTTCTR